MKVFITLVLTFVLVTVFALLAAFPTMWIVNYLFTPQVLVSLFGISQLTFWKAYWLNWICSALFKGTCTSESK